MSWLLRQYWIWVLVAFLLGLLISWLLMVRRAKREVPVHDKGRSTAAAGAAGAAGLATKDGDRDSSVDVEGDVDTDADADTAVKADAGLNGGAGLATGAGLGVGAAGATLAGKDDDADADDVSAETSSAGAAGRSAATTDADPEVGADEETDAKVGTAVGGTVAGAGAGAAAAGLVGRDDADRPADDSAASGAGADSDSAGDAGAVVGTGAPVLGKDDRESADEASAASAGLPSAGAFDGSGSGQDDAGLTTADASAETSEVAGADAAGTTLFDSDQGSVEDPAGVSAEMSPAGAFDGSGAESTATAGSADSGSAGASAGYTFSRDEDDEGDGTTVFSSDAEKESLTPASTLTETGSSTADAGSGSTGAATVAAGAGAGLAGAASASGSSEDRTGAYGEGSADPRPDGSAPTGFTIKGNVDSMLYHPGDSPYYGRTKAEVWFRTEDDATRAGFTRWDRKGDRAATLAAPVVPPGRFGEGSADPTDDGKAPDGFSIKGNEDSMLYHTQDSPYYGRTKAEIWFRTEDDATRNGFTRWDRRTDGEAASPEPGSTSARADASGGSSVGEPLFAGATDTAAPTNGNGGHLSDGSSDATAVRAGAYGEGSADPRPDGSAPTGFTIKGNVDSMLYHTQDSPYYGRTKAEVWFRTEDDATRAGFTRWDRKGDRAATLAAPVVPPGRFGEGSADPTDDGKAPDGFSIKGNEDSMLYHTQDSPYYGRTKAEIWFRTEDDATRNGFTRWDRR